MSTATPDEPQEVTVETLQKARLLDAIYQSPKHRGKLLGLIKEFSPDARIPEVDAPHEVLTAIRPHMEEIGKAKAALEQERAELKAERARERFVTKNGLSEAEVVEVDQLMKDKGISNPETAVEHYRMHQQVAAPRSAPLTPIQLPNFKGLFENPQQWAREEAYKGLAEAQASRR